MSSVSARTVATLLAGWRSAGVAYAALADRIRLLVLDGRIAPGTRLPAERELAAQLGVSRTTVTAAYAELRAAGYLSSLRGSGSMAQLPFRTPPSVQPLTAGYLDFSKATMPAIPEIVGAARLAAEQLPAYLGESGFDPVGLPDLRAALADRYTARGLPTTPDQLMVTIGAQHAIGLIARTLMSRGDRAVIENPTYPHALDALKAAGARLLPVSVTTDDGWDESALEQAIGSSPALGYLMPDHHNPTGRSMSADLRDHVLTLAARHGTTIVADETMAELGIDGPGHDLPFAAHGSAILVGSVGKTVWGGLRIGWIRADRSVIQRLVRARASGDLGTPLLEQLVVLNLLADIDSVLLARRTYLRAGRDRLASLLAERLPEWQAPHVRGGLTAWVNLGHPVSSQLVLAARTEGLIIAAGPRFGLDGAFERFLRIPFSYPAEETARAVDALAAAWATLARHPQFESTSEFMASVV